MMLRAKDAYLLIHNKYPSFEFDKCFNFEKFYTFSVKNTDGINGVFSVDKLTGIIKTFNPMSISIREFNSGKEIIDFM